MGWCNPYIIIGPATWQVPFQNKEVRLVLDTHYCSHTWGCVVDTETSAKELDQLRQMMSYKRLCWDGIFVLCIDGGISVRNIVWQHNAWCVRHTHHLFLPKSKHDLSVTDSSRHKSLVVSSFLTSPVPSPSPPLCLWPSGPGVQDVCLVPTPASLHWVM